MKQFFKELFEYSWHSNQQLAVLIMENPDKIPDTTLKLYSHIVNAHHIWNNRINDKTPTFGVWDIHPYQSFKDIDYQNLQSSIQLIDKHDLTDVIYYTNSKGQSFTNLVQDMLFQIINHSTYHRGQIAMECKQVGINPLPTDFILFKR